MKKTIKIKFTGFAPYHDPHQQAYYRFLSKRYELVESDKPDYIIDGGQSFHHVKYDAIKILLNSENEAPDFNAYDYAVGSSELTFGDRYLRVPWFAFYPCFAQLDDLPELSDDELLNRKFCSFVVSNAEFGDPMRRKFFERLSKYKQVSSGGKWRNNVGGPVEDKLDFCRGYKFNIAFENSACLGYTTEKIMEAYVARTLPIYYGNPTIETDFSLDSMVRVKGEDDIERAVEEIIELDRDDALYLKKLKTPCLVEASTSAYIDRLNGFLASIFDRPLEEARRLSSYGHQAMLRQHLKLVLGVDQAIRDFPGYDFGIRCLAAIRSWRKGLA